MAQVKGQKKLIFTAPAHIQGVKTLVDGTVKLDVAVSKEIAPPEMATLFEARKAGIGWFAFSPNDLDMADLPDKPAKGDDRKSPSERLYAVMFLRWKHLTNQAMPFDDWYSLQMNRIIENLKKGLPPKI